MESSFSHGTAIWVLRTAGNLPAGHSTTAILFRIFMDIPDRRTVYPCILNLPADLIISPSPPAACHTVGVIDQKSLRIISVDDDEMPSCRKFPGLHGTNDNAPLVQFLFQNPVGCLGLPYIQAMHIRHILQQLPGGAGS